METELKQVILPLKLYTQKVFNITGRGTVYTISMKENNINKDKLSETLMGKEVEIEGEMFLVRGIETAGYSDVIGVLVRKLN